MYCTPGPDNSRRINTEKAVPINPENKANIKYKVPISFALEDKSHLSFHGPISVNIFNKRFRFSVISSPSAVKLESYRENLFSRRVFMLEDILSVYIVLLDLCIRGIHEI